MIAACPKCAARYRVERERLEAGGVRLRCARCEAVFRVRPPDAAAARPAPAGAKPPPAGEPRRAPAAAAPAALATAALAPSAAASPSPRPNADVVLVAMPEGELATRTAAALAQRGLAVLRASDGVEAMLEIQRKLPRAVVLAADLAKMFGFQICEVLKRNESLRGIWVVLVGAIHNRDRYRRAPGELYGADAYVEGPDLPDGLLPLLAKGGLGLAPASVPAVVKRPPLAAPLVAPAAAAPPRAAAPPLAAAAPPLAPVREVPAPPPAPSLAPPPALAPRPKPVTAARAPSVAAPPPRRSDGLEDERAKAERLARIVVSDIVLYNDQRFTAAVRAGNVLEAMAGELAEGRQLFEERIDGRVRAERDHLKDELLRSARAREAR